MSKSYATRLMKNFVSYAELGKLSKLKEAISIGVNLNTVDENGWTALTIASGNKKPEIVLELLNYPSLDINKPNFAHGSTALHYFCINNNLELVKKFLERNDIDISLQDGEGNTALMYACMYSEFQIVQEFLKHKDRSNCINKQNNHGKTALSMACNNRSLKLVQELLKCKDIHDSFNKLDINGNTVLMNAISNSGVIEIIRELLKNSLININIQNNNGETALIIACRFANLTVIQELLKHKELSDSFNYQNENGDTALNIACGNSSRHIVRELLKHREVNGVFKIDINKQNTVGDTPLIVASREGYIEIVKELLKCQELELNKQNRNLRTALLEAYRTRDFSESNQKCIFRLLLKDKRINIKICDSQKLSILDYIITDKTYDALKDLISYTSLPLRNLYAYKLNESIRKICKDIVKERINRFWKGAIVRHRLNPVLRNIADLPPNAVLAQPISSRQLLLITAPEGGSNYKRTKRQNLGKFRDVFALTSKCTQRRYTFDFKILLQTGSFNPLNLANFVLNEELKSQLKQIHNIMIIRQSGATICS